MKVQSLDELKELKKQGIDLLYPQNKIKIRVGMATCGLACGAEKVYEAIKEEVAQKGLKFIVTKTGCLGFCQREPLIDVLQPGTPRLTYQQMTEDKTKELLKYLVEGKIYSENLLCKFEQEEVLIGDDNWKYKIAKTNGNLKDIPSYEEVPFFRKQSKVALRNCGFIDPEDILEYIARGGYFSLHKVLTSMSPEEVIESMKSSGLRGRGGAGFPTGLKWDFTRKAHGDIKYVICNADEGDPGAYMDRSVLEGDPHSVLEGMLIGAYAIGSEEGYIYIRAEYPLAIERLQIAIKQAEEYGLVGENIFNSGFSFKLNIAQGAGAFVCGEETSLIASIEGKDPEPRQRPPFPAQCGLFGKPTNINNVETWANVAVIISKGHDWFSKMGTDKSKGTKVFSLVGKVNNTGLVEVPMGITLKEIIYDIGAGIPAGKKFKAVQTGGPSGGCIPAELLELPVDYEQLAEAGSIMGSGGMVVMDEDTCVVDVAKFFLKFTNDESCGKCTSCREGSAVLLEILTKISEGKGKKEDMEFLEELSIAIKDSSLCGLGQTLPNPVLSTIQYFRDEYEAHIKEKRCPAGVCRELIQYTIDKEKCTGCVLCAKNCPQGAITGEKKQPHIITQSKCIKCGICFDMCKFEAVVKE